MPGSPGGGIGHHVVGDRFHHGVVHHAVGDKAPVLTPPALTGALDERGDVLAFPVGHAVGGEQLEHVRGHRPAVPGLDPGDLRRIASKLGGGFFNRPPDRLAVMP
jgi:hypothetical protein